MMRKFKLSAFIGSLLFLLATQAGFAEQKNVPRTGAFAQPGPPTPRCDNLADGIEKYVGRGADYTVDWLADQGHAYTRLLQGDPDAFLHQIERTWSDMGTAGSYVASEGLGSVVLLETVFEEVLPDSGIASFLADGRKLAGEVVADAFDTLETDVSEISHDLWDVVEQIEDPEAFAGALGSKFQKWSPVGALSYVFTEGDPLEGAEKAANALVRQADIFTYYIAPYAKAPNVLGGTGRAVTIYNKLQRIPGMPGPKATEFDKRSRGVVRKLVLNGIGNEFLKQGQALLEQSDLPEQNRDAIIAVMALVNARLMEASVTGEHPFYRAEIRTVPAQWMKDNHEDGGRHKWSVWHPIVENDSDCISLGDAVISDRGGHLSGTRLRAVCGATVSSGRGRWWTRPIDYDLVWGDNCSGGEHNRSIWAPVCAPGYSGVGFVGWYGSWEKPLPNRIACLQNDPQLVHLVDGMTAGLRWAASDQDSGAKYDVTVYNRKFAGMDLMFATPSYPADRAAYPATVMVPVPWGMPGNAGIAWLTPDGTQVLTRALPEPPAQKAPTYTHQVYYVSDQQNAYYVTSDDRLVRVTPQGQVMQTGTVIESQDPRFEAVLQMQHGWAGVDADGNMWAQNPADGSWIHTGSVAEMQGASGATPSKPGVPAATLNWSYFQADAGAQTLTCQLLGRIVNARGKGVRTVVRFYYLYQGSWSPVTANAQETQYRDESGLVATQVDFMVPGNDYEFPADPAAGPYMTIPYYAFNFAPSGLTIPMRAVATLYVDGAQVAVSPGYDFELAW